MHLTINSPSARPHKTSICSAPKFSKFMHAAAGMTTRLIHLTISITLTAPASNRIFKIDRCSKLQMMVLRNSCIFVSSGWHKIENNSTIIIAFASIREEPSLNVLPGISSPPRLPSGPETTWIIFPSRKPQCMLVNVIPAVLYWLLIIYLLYFTDVLLYLLYFTLVMGTIICWVDNDLTLWKYVS